MKSSRFSEDVRSVTDLKQKSAEIVQQVRKSRRPVLLTRRGRGVAVLLDLQEYEAMADRLAFVDAGEAGVKEFESGRLHRNEEALKILDSFGK